MTTEADYADICRKFFEHGATKSFLIQAFLNKFKDTCGAERAYLLESHEDANTIIITSDRSQAERKVTNANEVMANDNPILRGLIYIGKNDKFYHKDLFFQDVRIAKIGLSKPKKPNVIEKMIAVAKGGLTNIVNHYRLIRLSEEINKSRLTFLSLLGNEIRGPLNGIFGFLRLDRSSKGGDANYALLTRSVKDLVGTINNLVDMLHIETGKYRKPIVITSLRDTIVNVTSLLRSICNDIVIETKVGPEVPSSLRMDNESYSQIINNVSRTLHKLARDKKVQIGITYPSGKLVTELKCNAWGGSGHSINHETLLLDLTRKLVRHMKGSMDIIDTDDEVKFCITVDTEPHHDSAEVVENLRDKNVLVVASKNRMELLKKMTEMKVNCLSALTMEEANLLYLKSMKDKIGIIVVESALDDSKDYRLPKLVIKNLSDISHLHDDMLQILKSKADSVSLSMEELEILYVDDDAINREIMHSMLDQIGYSSHVIKEDGVYAYEEFTAHPEKYHVILTDIKMTRMGGEELSRKIDEYCKLHKLMRPTIIGVSAYSMDNDKEDINKRAVLDDFISKPVDLEQLKKILDNL